MIKQYIVKLLLWLHDWSITKHDKLIKKYDHPFKLMKPDHVIEKAFMINGVQYYSMTDTFNTSCHRMMSAINVLDEWQNRMTRETNKAFVESMLDVINSPEGVKISKLIDLVNKMKERLDLPVPTEDIMLQMASALFFDENESPYEYDKLYNINVKIPALKKALEQKKIDTFFLYSHLKTPLGLPDISAQDLAGAMMIVSAIVNEHQKKLKNHLSKESLKN